MDEEPIAYRVESSIGLIAFSLGVAVVGFLSLMYFARRSFKDISSTAGIRGPATRPARRGRAAQMRAIREEEIDFEDNDLHNSLDPDEMNDIIEDLKQKSGKVGAKKLKKMEMKAEKRAQREAMEQEREERKRRTEMLEKKRQREDAEREAAEKEEEAEKERIKQEKAKEELEEYLLLKEQFTIEEEGCNAGLTEEENNSLLQEFISFIKNKKVVSLEELACQFHLRTQECVQRVKSLQDQNLISGVFDDRGKFIYVSDEDLLSLVNFIKQRGRVSFTELSQSSSRIINLSPTTEAVVV